MKNFDSNCQKKGDKLTAIIKDIFGFFIIDTLYFLDLNKNT